MVSCNWLLRCSYGWWFIKIVVILKWYCGQKAYKWFHMKIKVMQGKLNQQINAKNCNFLFCFFIIITKCLQKWSDFKKWIHDLRMLLNLPTITPKSIKLVQKSQKLIIKKLLINFSKHFNLAFNINFRKIGR